MSILKYLWPSRKSQFKWVRHSEFVQLYDLDVSEDPVRPELDLEFRTDYSREIYGLKFQNEILGVICIAYTNDIPCSVKELDLMSQIAHLKSFLTYTEQEKERIAVAYTVWSNKKGAGKLIMQKALEYMRENSAARWPKSGIHRMVTLSPLTPGATHYHIRNGAKLINISLTSQNFEYDLE